MLLYNTFAKPFQVVSLHIKSIISMGATIIEKIISAHAGNDTVHPGDIVDVDIDARVARDFGGANVVKNLECFDLSVDNPDRTFFTFDCNPGDCNQKYPTNQHIFTPFARKN